MPPTASNKPHLQPFDASSVPQPAATALSALEDEFTFDVSSVVKQMLWEFSQGLTKPQTDETRDTYLPMMCVELLSLSLDTFDQLAHSPTYVHNVPDGSETGTFIALDLGGTNLRVCEVELKGKGEFSLRQEKFKVSDELKTGDAAALFAYIAQRCLHSP